MKTYFIMASIVICALLPNVNVNAQSTSGNNNPGGGKFLGFNAGQNLEFRTNNILRMQMMETGNSTINGFVVNRSGFLGLSTDPTFFTSGSATPFSLLHLNGDNPVGIPDFNGYRPWMRYGITFTHNQDLMFIGQRRIADDITNATIAWADNSFGSPNGPDNLTFVYTAGDGTDPSGPTSDGGLEVARMTTQGHTGIGTLWSNTLQPMRTLDVVRNDGAPQFRITRTQSSTATSGRHTDFLTSAAGDLHILSRNFSNNRRVAIGFLDNLTPSERLDVLGTVRLRQMPDNAPDVLITGVEQDATGDYALNYLGFPGGDDVFLSGDGTWVPGSIDCEWNLVNNGGSDDLVMGYGGACNEGRVGIGNAGVLSSENGGIEI